MINIPSDVSRVLDIITENGFGAWLTGGCVRDSVMNCEPGDWDIATDVPADRLKDIFSSFRTIDIGTRHGTIIVLSGHFPVEITGLRSDKNGKCDIFTDLSQRDFTMNAMAYSPSDGLIDPFKGKEDIENGIIRCTVNADERITEDPLRIMRALRFASVKGFEIEENTAAAITKNENLLAGVPAERIQNELLKILCGDNILQVLTRFRSVFGVIIPELRLEFDFQQHGKKHGYDVWLHTAHTVSNIESDEILRLTMLLHDTGKIATHEIDENGSSTFRNHAAVGGVIAKNILTRLKMSNKMIKTVSYLVSIHDKEVPETREEVQQYINELGEENFIRLMKIRRADKSGLAKPYRDITDKLLFAYRTFDEIMNETEI